MPWRDGQPPGGLIYRTEINRMQRRSELATRLKAFARRASTALRPITEGIARHAVASIETLESRQLLSTTYFVAPNGTDSAAGTLAQPFRTIQDAANVANTGDTVSIEAGTYRETVKPAHNGVTFTNYNNQTVIVSGADLLTGWSNSSGSIYTASMSTDLGEGSNQVFVDGQMVNEARWPNSSPDVSHPTESTISSYSNGIIYDSSATQANGFWTGATIHITPGDGWVGYTGIVTNSGPGWLQVSLPSLSSSEQPIGGNSYYLSGKFQALDSAGEWYRDSSGTLYLWDPSSDNPGSHTVEVKSRQYAFDLSGISGTTIQGINLFAASLHTNWASTNTTINGITAEYLTQFNNLWGSGWTPPGAEGIELYGSNSIVENSTIAYSAGDGIYVNASNCLITNNTIHDVDYSGTDAAGVFVYANNVQVDHNTIYNVGRDGINLHGTGIKILNNTVHDFMLQTFDGGGIYTVGDNGQGSEIAYNSVYNAHDNNTNGLDAAGIMLDNDSSNFVIHNNSTWNVDSGFKANNSSYNEQVYNNQFGGTQYAVESNGWVGFAYDWGGSQFHDNVFYNSNLKLGANVSQWNNTFAGGQPSAQTSGTTQATPVPPALVASQGQSKASGGQASGIPTPAPTPAPPAALASNPGSAATSQLAGSIAGAFTMSGKNPKTGSTYTLTAHGNLGVLTKIKITGKIYVPGTVKKKVPASFIRITTAKGSMTLTLTGSTAAGSLAAPTNFVYVVTAATGQFKHGTGQGTINLILTPTTPPAPRGTFNLVSQPT
jgi:hypothetical protein